MEINPIKLLLLISLVLFIFNCSNIIEGANGDGKITGQGSVDDEQEAPAKDRAPAPAPTPAPTPAPPPAPPPAQPPAPPPVPAATQPNTNTKNTSMCKYNGNDYECNAAYEMISTELKKMKEENQEMSKQMESLETEKEKFKEEKQTLIKKIDGVKAIIKNN